MENEKNMNKIIISKKVYKLCNFVLAGYFALCTIFLLIYLIAPITGGIFSLTAVFYFGSHMIMAFFIKFFLGQIYNSNPISPLMFVIFAVYSTICYYLWFESNVALLFSAISLIVTFFGYKKYSLFLSDKENSGA